MGAADSSLTATQTTCPPRVAPVICSRSTRRLWRRNAASFRAREHRHGTSVRAVSARRGRSAVRRAHPDDGTDRVQAALLRLDPRLPVVADAAALVLRDLVLLLHQSGTARPGGAALRGVPADGNRALELRRRGDR